MFMKPFGSDCASVYRTRPDIKWHFNTLLQNIDRIPPKSTVEVLGEVGTMTATTAHKAYATNETALRLGCPVHHFSTWVCPEAYEHSGYRNKEKVIIVSADRNPARAQILEQISSALPDHRIVEIRNMKYQDYRRLLKTAKFAFTFGEGLDGYFMETVFSGGIGMAIFNERYFTKEYENLDGIFKSAQDAISDVAKFLKAADEEKRFTSIARQQFEVGRQNYVGAEYVQNLKNFYDRYLPKTLAGSSTHSQ
jgi:hypothetical protein